MRCEGECVYVEEQEPNGRLILTPCLTCGLTAMDALADYKSMQGRVDQYRDALRRIDGFRVASVAHVDARTITEMRDVAREVLDGVR